MNVQSIFKFDFAKNIQGDFSRKFGESLDKTWREKAFPWKLGGLNCVLVMTRFQMSPSSWGVELSELADEGEQGPTSKAKYVNVLCADATEWSVTGEQTPGGHGGSFAKTFFWLRMAVSWKRNFGQPPYDNHQCLRHIATGLSWFAVCQLENFELKIGQEMSDLGSLWIHCAWQSFAVYFNNTVHNRPQPKASISSKRSRLQLSGPKDPANYEGWRLLHM